MQIGPALRAAAGIAVLSIMDAVIKGMSAYYPTFQVAFLRFACGSLVVAGVVAVLRPGWPSRETVAANSIRSVIAVVTAVMPFTGIPLPWISFGGSSLVTCMAGVGLLLNISGHIRLEQAKIYGGLDIRRGDRRSRLSRTNRARRLGRV